MIKLAWFVSCLLLLCPKDDRPEERTVLTIEQILSKEQLYVILASRPTAPGTVAHFDTPKGTLVVRLYQKIKGNRFLGKVYIAQKEAAFDDVVVGAQAETDTRKAYTTERFWETLHNIYIDNNEDWVAHCTLDSNRTVNRVKVNEPVLLDLRNPPIDGFICVLAVYPDHQVELIYPNRLPGGQNRRRVMAHMPYCNLNYDIRKLHGTATQALLNTGLAFDRVGKVDIIVLLSRNARPLSDFLPSDTRYNYWDIEHQEVLQPECFGPGYWDPSRRAYDGDHGVDFLPGDGWAVGRLGLEVS